MKEREATQGDRIRDIKQQREANFEWSQEQTERFNIFEQNRPELAYRIAHSREVVMSAGEHDPKFVRGHWRILKSLGFLPTPKN